MRSASNPALPLAVEKTEAPRLTANPQSEPAMETFYASPLGSLP